MFLMMPVKMYLAIITLPAEVTGDPEKEAVKFLNDVFNAMQIETKSRSCF